MLKQNTGAGRQNGPGGTVGRWLRQRLIDFVICAGIGFTVALGNFLVLIVMAVCLAGLGFTPESKDSGIVVIIVSGFLATINVVFVSWFMHKPLPRLQQKFYRRFGLTQ